MKAVDKSAPREDKKMFGLIYGGSGTGKTELIGTLGELGRVLVIDIDEGHETLLFSPQLVKFRDNLTIASFESFGDFDVAYKAVEKNDPAHWSKVLGATIEHPFDFIVWDTWSEAQWWMTDELHVKNNRDTERGVDIGFRANLQIQDWGSVTDLNKLALREFRRVKTVHQFFTMQEKIVQDSLTKALVKGPAIHGQLVTELPAWFGIVIRTYVNLQNQFATTTLPKQGWPAKTRYGVGIDGVGNSMKKLLGW